MYLPVPLNQRKLPICRNFWPVHFFRYYMSFMAAYPGLRLADRSHRAEHNTFPAFQAFDLIDFRQAVTDLSYGACRTYPYRGARMILRASFLIYCNAHC